VLRGSWRATSLSCCCTCCCNCNAIQSTVTFSSALLLLNTHMNATFALSTFSLINIWNIYNTIYIYIYIYRYVPNMIVVWRWNVYHVNDTNRLWVIAATPRSYLLWTINKAWFYKQCCMDNVSFMATIDLLRIAIRPFTYIQQWRLFQPGQKAERSERMQRRVELSRAGCPGIG